LKQPCVLPLQHVHARQLAEHLPAREQVSVQRYRADKQPGAGCVQCFLPDAGPELGAVPACPYRQVGRVAGGSGSGSD